MSTAQIIAAIAAAIVTAGGLIAKAVRWSTQQVVQAHRRSVDALIENARSNAQVTGIVNVMNEEMRELRDDIRAHLRKEKTDRSDRATKTFAVAPPPSKPADESKRHRAGTERGLSRRRGDDDRERSDRERSDRERERDSEERRDSSEKE